MRPSGASPDHPDVGLVFENHPEAGPHEALVVGHDDVDRSRGHRRLERRRFVCGVVAPAHAGGRHALRDPAEPDGADGIDTLGQARPSDPADHLRGEDLTRPGRVAQAAGHDHRRAVQVIALGQWLAGVEPYAERELAAGGGRALHVDRAPERRDCAREGDHQARRRST